MSEKRKGLGRGLSALLPSAGDEVRSLPIRQLAPNRFQPRSRFEDADLEQLTESIRVQGVLQPIVVTRLDSNSYTIIAGERRWRAAQRAGLAAVPVVVREVRDEGQLLELALVENLQRADLNAIEEAEAYRTLSESFGLSHEEIGQRVGHSRTAVSNSLRLLKLPESVCELIRAGELSAGQARPLLALQDAKKIEQLARRAVDRGLTARALEEMVGGGAARGTRKRAAPPPEPNTAVAAERLTQTLQSKVEIARRRRGGVIKIHFHSEEELMRLFDRLVGRAPRR